MRASKSLRAYAIPMSFAVAAILAVTLAVVPPSHAEVAGKAMAGTDGSAAAGNPLLVLSYNVCWQCMTHTSSGSATHLGSDCVFVQGKTKTTICAEHMAALIERTPGDYGAANYDFVSIQEGSNWPALAAAAPNTLGKLTARPYKNGREWGVTFYDPSKYQLTNVHTYGGDSGHGYTFEVLIFEPNELIFVNVHNCHDYQQCDLTTLEEQLSHFLLGLHLDPEELQKLKSFRVIAAGDFNESGQGGLHGPGGTQGELSFAPFAFASIPTTVSVENPPVTCCSQRTPWSGFRSGDFILDSQGAVTPVIPKGYDRNLIQSDHLPVVAVLPASP